MLVEPRIEEDEAVSMEQERALERTRAEARERVRVAQEREARAWQVMHRPVIERATLAARHRGMPGPRDAAAETQAPAEAGDDTRMC